MNEICIKIDCFNLKYTLECGQCFRWEKQDEDGKEYIGVIHDRVLKVRQNGNMLYVTSNNMNDLQNVVIKYFDLDSDYIAVEKRIEKYDKYISKAVKNTSGIRHLNQDFFETLISFIISANNNIPRISKSIKKISESYGTKIIFENKEYYLFPTAQQLKDVSIDEYRKCGVGFRDSYIFNTVYDMLNGKINENMINELSTEELRKVLLTFKGVGPKVADCILLFACHKREVFPVDVWVERVMSNLYFTEYKGKMTKKDILQYAKERFGDDSGIVNQHLFYNVREGLI